MTHRIRRAVLFFLVASSPALGSGFYFGENGTKALSQGGAFAGQADDLTAIQHNPAGLAQQEGYGFLLDVQLLRHDVSFLRKDPGGVTFSGTNQIQNAPGAFLLPNLGVGYGTQLWNRRFTFAFGVYGPPSVGKYGYPAPNYADKDPTTGRYVNNPRKWAPQRYGLIENDVIILYPSLSAGYEVHPMVSFGASVQYVYSSMMFEQAVYSGLFEPKLQRDEEPTFDSIVRVTLQGKPTVTGILGVMVKPAKGLSIGASFRPAVPVKASGKFNIALGDTATALNTVVTGDQADFALTLPMEAKLGVRYEVTGAIGVNADFVYQGWDSLQEFLLTPKDINITIGSGEPTAVAPFHIEKHWRATMSGRLGGSFQANDFTARLGVLLEQGASPEEYTNIDFAHFDRLFLTAGAGYKFQGFEVVAAGVYTPPVTKEVTTSEVRAGSTDASVPGAVVGLGTYTSGGWIASVGIRGSFGGKK
ncbi:MAG: OmpP1/FadL family transporter [Myxococcaceae bacterium]